MPGAAAAVKIVIIVYLYKRCRTRATYNCNARLPWLEDFVAERELNEVTEGKNPDRGKKFM